jgi:RNA polymerase sigma-70 factor (ECF subfamily)
LQSISDAELIERAQDQSVDMAVSAPAIGELYDRYHEDVFRYIWARVSNQQLAEDLTGEVFIRMVTHLPKYRSSGTPFAAWLYRIARNLVVDHYRKVSNRYEMLPIDEIETLPGEEQSVANQVENQLFVEQVHGAIKQLKPDRQDIIILRFIIGLPSQTVADILGKTLGSIKVKQHRAIKELRRILEPPSGEES